MTNLDATFPLERALYSHEPLSIGHAIIVVVRSANQRIDRGAINDNTTVIHCPILRALRFPAVD
jgi:hypothetical protein